MPGFATSTQTRQAAWDLMRALGVCGIGDRHPLQCGRMSKTFRAWKIDEPLLLPVTVQEPVPKEHLARFVLSVVEEELDLSEILSCVLHGLAAPCDLDSYQHDDGASALRVLAAARTAPDGQESGAPAPKALAEDNQARSTRR